MIRLTSVASLSLPPSEALVSKSSSTSLAIAMSWLLAGVVMLQPSLVGAQQSPAVDRGIIGLGSAAPVRGVHVVAPTAPVGPVQMPSATWRPIVVELPGEQVNAAVAQQSDRNNVAWMAVGAAALMVGLLIGGDAGTVVAVTGGVIGLMGLFRYMN